MLISFLVAFENRCLLKQKYPMTTHYCQLPTANLVHQNLGVEQKYLHPLPMNEPTVIFSKDKAVKVTLLDANHCPGAVMFLFEIGNRRILHVGDFRWNQTIMLDIPQIRALSTMNPRLDELYLDTTYCNPKYELPTQEEAIAAAIDVASEEMQKSKRGSKTLFLFGSYTIGKEKIYLSVAQHLKQKVYVDSRRLRILKALDWPDERMSIFTSKKEETCLWVVPLGKVNFKDMPDFLEQANKSKAGKALSAKYERVVGFRPTGWTYTAKDKKQTLLPCGKPKPSHLISSKTNGKFSVHGVPYSEHSSFPELVDCIRCLKPRKIVTTVSPSKSEEQIELLLNAANALD
jgi:DNA cross-link repair 1A protein